MITFKQLQYALALQNTLHFKKAAALCSVTQSTLSSAISELESHLSTQLFERDNKSVHVTPIGHAILAKARKIHEDLQVLEQIPKQQGGYFAHPLSIGVIPTIGPYLLPKSLPIVRKKFPNAKLTLIEAQSEKLVHQVKSGKLDTAIIALPYPHDTLLAFEFWQESFKAVVHESDPDANSTSISSKTLKTKHLLMLEEGHCLTDHAMSVCKFKTTAPNLSLEGTSLYTIVQMVANNLGATLVPAMSVSQLIGKTKELSVLTIESSLSGPHRRIAFITRVSSPRVDDIQLLSKIFNKSLC